VQQPAEGQSQSARSPEGSAVLRGNGAITAASLAMMPGALPAFALVMKISPSRPSLKPLMVAM
jgi:hypothetical protein